MEINDLDNKMQSLTVHPNDDQVQTGLFCARRFFLSDEPTVWDDVQRKKIELLKYAVKWQENERNDTSFSRDCLFCRKHFTGNRTVLLNHLRDDHNFFIGAPDNIVFVNEFLDVLSKKLERLKCLFCEKTFKDWNVLKEHMRKKQHKMVNPHNKEYDKFYIANYAEFNSPQADFRNAVDSDEDTYMECEEEADRCMCLLCPETLEGFESTLWHMKELHKFDFNELKENHKLDFYMQVKLVNYIRHVVRSNTCFLCGLQLATNSQLLNHMITSGHVTRLPANCNWDVANFYVPTIPDDSFLCGLDDGFNDEDDVYCEECTPAVVPLDNRTKPNPVTS